MLPRDPLLGLPGPPPGGPPPEGPLSGSLFPPGGPGGYVEQTRGQRQTGCNDFPGRVRELLKWMVRVESKKC